MTNINPRIFNVKYEREFLFDIDQYLNYCKNTNRKPSQRGYEEYCKVLIYEILMNNSKEIMIDLDITMYENHIEAISKLT